MIELSPICAIMLHWNGLTFAAKQKISQQKNNDDDKIVNLYLIQTANSPNKN